MKKILFFLILSGAFFFRIYKLDLVPPSLNWDEVSHGYNAYSILKTGKDEWGIKFPLIFRAYGDYKLPLYIYLTTIFEAIFGLNAFSVRLVSVFSGVGLVLLAYLITKNLTKDDFWGIFSAFLVAFSPWGLFVSRVAAEANLGAFLFALGMYFLLLWIKEREQKHLIFLSLFWGFSLHAYNSARILVPLGFLFILIFLFLFLKRKLRGFILPLVIFLIFLTPVLTQFLNRSASARYEWVSLLDEATIYQIGEKRANSNLPFWLGRVLFNKPTFFLFYSLKNYLKNLSLNYLFFRGGSHYQFSLPGYELLYLVTGPFLLLGILLVLKKKDLFQKTVLIWFFGGFFPSAITKDSPHVLRSLFVLPTPMILTALGAKFVADFLKKKSQFGGKLVIGVLFIMVLISFSRWWKNYLDVYPKIYSWAWQFGYKEAVDYVKETYQKYDKIFFSKKYGEPHEFVAFYFPWEPKKFQEQREWDYHANWYWTNGFDKFVFVNDWEIKNVKCQMSNVKCLLITSPGNYPEGWTKMKTINFLDGKPVFEILER